MRVSIIIPFYNSKNYLGSCIESAVSQSYEDIEIILVNDGSADGSGDICRSFAAKDQRIKIIEQQNAGVSAARNAGIDASSGELLSFIDSDDYVEADYIEYLTGLMEKHGSDIACCGHEETEDTKCEPREISGSEECLKEYLTTNEIYASVWGKIYRKELFDGIRFPVGKRFEDNYVLFRLIDRCDLITVGYQKKYHYVSHPESFVNKPFTESQMDIVDAMLAQREFVVQKYPSLTGPANARVVYAANRCLVKMAESGVYDDALISRIEPLYKEYGKDFLKGTSGSTAKSFYRVARISPKLAMRLYRLMRK